MEKPLSSNEVFVALITVGCISVLLMYLIAYIVKKIRE